MSARLYELVYIVSPDATEQQVTDVHEQVDAIVSRMEGQIQKTDNWGRRKLAYEIARHKEGVYVFETISGSGDLMKEIDRRLKVTDLIVRHMIVRIDEEQKVAERMLARRQAEAEQRRLRRGTSGDGEERRRDADEDDDQDQDQESEE
ncbi:MAG: 30S ribosomal protein S6 [Acidobacteriota bacterium]|nr:30S ribosomal protein S6 [Acidobacteriota bacterium]